MADAGFGSDLHRRAHVLRGQADDLTAAITACAALARDIDTAVDHGDGLRGRVAELEQRMAAADLLLLAAVKTAWPEAHTALVHEARAALRGDQ